MFSAPSTPRARRPPKARSALQSTTPAPSSPAPSTSAQPAPFEGSSSFQPGGSRTGTSLRTTQYASSAASIDDEDRMSTFGGGREALAGAGSAGAPAEARCWVRTQRQEAVAKGELPPEVEHFLKGADLYTTPLGGSLDAATGFATLCTRSQLFVWNHVTRSHSSPTLYAFPLPSASSLCLPHLVANSGGREPGVLVVSPDGETRFWEGVSQALVGGGDRFVQGEVAGLVDGEMVHSITEVEPGNYILSTSHRNLFLLTLSHSAGRSQIVSHAFPRSSSSSGILSRFFGSSTSSPSSSSGSSTSDHGFAPSVCVLSVDGTKTAFVLSGRSLQRWTLGSRQPYLASEQPLAEHLMLAVSGGAGLDSIAAVSLEAHALQTLGEDRGELAVLVSFVDHGADRFQAGGGEQRRFAVAVLGFSSAGETHVSRLVGCDYRTDVDPRPLPAPSLVIPGGGSMAFITIPACVLVVSLDPSSAPYEEVIALRETARNAFLGLGLASMKEVTDKLDVVVMSKGSGLLGVTVSLVARAEETGLDRASLATARLKSKLEQAVFFGDRPENPLSFDLRGGYDGNLVLAAEQVSHEILCSTSPSMSPIVDLRSQLLDRINRLQGLINFIARNGLLGKLSQASRRKLSWHAEKLSACADLWTYQNSKISGEAIAGTPKGLLADAISSVMSQHGFAASEDVVRLFFRARPNEIGAVLDSVASKLRSALGSRDRELKTSSCWLLESNRIFLTTNIALLTHRKQTNDKYGLDGEPTAEPWSASPSMVDSLEYLATVTDAIVSERTREFGSALDEEQGRVATSANLTMPTASAAAAGGGDMASAQTMQHEFKTQLSELAGVLFAAFEERIKYLLSHLEMQSNADPALDREALALRDRYLTIRPRVIMSLVRIGRSDAAFALAEHHRDYRALVELCNDPHIGQAERAQNYIEMFRDKFAFELYDWYVEKGKYKTLLTQDDVYGSLVMEYLDQRNLPRLSWMHDLAMDRLSVASQALLRESESEPKIASKQLMLSLSKLCQVVVVERSNDSSEERSVLDGLDDRLDMIDVHEALLSKFNAVISTSDAHSTTPKAELMEGVTRELAPGLQRYPVLRQLFIKLGSDLLSGRTLAAEDLVDLMTLKANTGDAVSDFLSALDVFARAREIPSGRREMMLVSIWRRIYLRDDWLALSSTSNLTDEGLEAFLRSTALYQTCSLLSGLSSATPTDIPTLSPTESLLKLGAPTPASSPAELAARFTDADADGIEQLWADMRAEDRALATLLEGDGEGGRLGLWAKEVARLIRKEQDEETGKDTGMQD